MKTWHLAILVIVPFVCSAVPTAGQAADLPGNYKTWLEEEVVYIISPLEKEAFLKLPTNGERDLFIEEFWKQRDPTPGTPRNEYREEHRRRIDYVNKRFGWEARIKGWRTDRGRIYIILGPPFDLQKFQSPDILPTEIWYYLGAIRFGQPTFFRLLFFEEYGAGEHKLYNPVSDGAKSLVPFPDQAIKKSRREPTWREKAREEAALPPEWTAADALAHRILNEFVSGELADTSLSLFPGFNDPGQALRSSAFLDEIKSYPWKRINPGYISKFLARPGPVEVDYSVHPMENRARVSVFEDSSGEFLLNFAVSPEVFSFDFFQDRYLSGLQTIINVTDAGGKTVFEQEKFYPVEMQKPELKALVESSLELTGFFPLNPGNYTFSLLLENTFSKEFTSVEKKISVPDGGRLQMSPLLVSRNVIKGSSEGARRAYQVGPYQIYPSVDNTVLETDRLFLFFQIYGLSRDLAEEGSLELTLSSEGKVLDSSRQKVRDSENRRDFLKEFTLDKLAPGTYTVKAALLDKEDKEVVSERTEVVVSAKPLPRSWILSRAELTIIPARSMLSTSQVQTASPDQ
jgi:GWxTD domain-containing protein